MCRWRQSGVPSVCTPRASRPLSWLTGSETAGAAGSLPPAYRRTHGDVAAAAGWPAAAAGAAGAPGASGAAGAGMAAVVAERGATLTGHWPRGHHAGRDRQGHGRSERLDGNRHARPRRHDHAGAHAAHGVVGGARQAQARPAASARSGQRRAKAAQGDLVAPFDVGVLGDAAVIPRVVQLVETGANDDAPDDQVGRVRLGGARWRRRRRAGARWGCLRRRRGRLAGLRGVAMGEEVESHTVRDSSDRGRHGGQRAAAVCRVRRMGDRDGDGLDGLTGEGTHGCHGPLTIG